ncbi:hypothetical protein [Paenibacillus massiliensis]|uniref:hypothetical protein n=1 Tax=Paenibacillus massiliensis TaxID=225917 RepID=UPI0004702B89|nr:hypothetical protein [Paenibacillus massiliensis]
MYINMNAHYGVSLNSTQRVQIQASGGLSLSGGRIQFVGSDGLHLGTTTEKLDLAEQVNSQGTEVQLEASVHQFYGEPLLSAFEQQVAEQGIGMVMASRALDNALEEGKGALDAGIEFVEGIWNMAVDVLDVGAQVLNMDESDFNHGRLGPGFLEHNETQEGLRRAMDATGNYIADTVMLKKSWSELGNDIKGAGESLIDPFVKVSEDEGNWLTRGTEESYNAGYNQVKAAERAVDIIAFGKGAAKLGKSIGDMSKRPSSVHGESADGRSGHGDGNSGGRPVVTPQWKYNLHEKAKSLGGDGKFKTNALRLPLDITSLEEFMQRLASRMNSSSKKLADIRIGDGSNGRPRWEFEDYSRMESDGQGGFRRSEQPPKDHYEDEPKRREDEERRRKDEEAEETGEGSRPNLYDKNGKYTGGRTQEELDDLARDPSHAGRIEEQGIKEREVGLDLEEQGVLGRIVRDPQADKGSDLIDITTGIKWDVKSFESYPHGHTSPKKGAFTVKRAMDKIYGEFEKGNSVIIDTRELVPEHIQQLRKAIEEDGIADRIIWYPT